MKQVTIGRSKDNDITINDASVSRHHATIIQTASGIIVSDNGSSNGTFVNGVRIRGDKALTSNDVLKLGSASIPWRNYFVFRNNEGERKTKIGSDQPQFSSNVNNQGQDNYTAIPPPRNGISGTNGRILIAVIITILGAIGGAYKSGAFESGKTDSGNSSEPEKNEVYTEPKGAESVKDTDSDGTPDTKDACPNNPGPTISNGCPDYDQDGTPDAEDACPKKPGPTISNGCPDYDEDGIPDIKDICWDSPGPTNTYGCPDYDEDGIPDSEDDCPNEFGYAELNGCPSYD